MTIKFNSILDNVLIIFGCISNVFIILSNILISGYTFVILGLCAVIGLLTFFICSIITIGIITVAVGLFFA